MVSSSTNRGEDREARIVEGRCLAGEGFYLLGQGVRVMGPVR